MERYTSKIGIGIVLFVAAVLGMAAFAMIIGRAWPGLGIIVIVAGFIVYLFKSTYYLIDGNQLIVKSGFMFKKTIQIDKIYKIAETNNPLSSPATSLDRLAIYYNEREWIMVSPRRKEEFIHQLTSMNGAIIVVRKK